MEKLKQIWTVITQPTGLKIMLAVLAAMGVNPDVATAISSLIPLTDTAVQAIGGLVAGGLVVKETIKDETK